MFLLHFYIYVFIIFRYCFNPQPVFAKADCRAKPGGAYFLSVGDTVFSPPTTDARLTIQFISLPTFHLEGRRILVFLIKLPSFLKQIFHIYHFLEEERFYKKNLVVNYSTFVFSLHRYMCVFFTQIYLCIQITYIYMFYFHSYICYFLS